jgi:hypothetical protein
MQQFGFYQITVNNPENGLGTRPSAPYPASQSRYGKYAEKHQHQQKRHQIQLLHIETHKKEMKLFMVKIQKEKMISVDFDPWKHQSYYRAGYIKPVTFYPIGNPAFQIFFGIDFPRFVFRGCAVGCLLHGCVLCHDVEWDMS